MIVITCVIKCMAPVWMNRVLCWCACGALGWHKLPQCPQYRHQQTDIAVTCGQSNTVSIAASGRNAHSAAIHLLGLA